MLTPGTVGRWPNVLVLLSDDLGDKETGCYGGAVNTTELDRLAAGGARFTDFQGEVAMSVRKLFIREDSSLWLKPDAPSIHRTIA